jgi:Flp pilus assembly pilin Flp
MDTIRRLFARLAVTMRGDVGAIATEYGLTLLLIALAIILAATAFGLAVAGLFDRATVVIPVTGS